MAGKRSNPICAWSNNRQSKHTITENSAFQVLFSVPSPYIPTRLVTGGFRDRFIPERTAT